jgi:hypothetical protein
MKVPLIYLADDLFWEARLSDQQIDKNKIFVLIEDRPENSLDFIKVGLPQFSFYSPRDPRFISKVGKIP